ncbi:odorant receptor 85c-like [Hyposmocoma kahamanoa]|uniref:odorant receptor 85c-like n=1 Tax=Hyposmocoma kahamanoa TaxID=1477025 RepID=UPI000E6D7697|nr:odorant receptor 85c-like [Hyposmocoma kahamanoa]
MGLLEKFLGRKSRNEEVSKERTLKYELKDYDETYAIPMAVLKLVGLRLQREDTVIVKFLWNVFYWFEFVNLFVVTWLELINMGQTASGGSFQDAVEIFRMMPCVGYLLLAMAKSYKIVYYRPVYENLVNELREMWPQDVVTEEEYNVIRNAMKQLKYVVQGYYWCNNALLVIFLSPPIVEIIKRALGYDVPLILPFFYWFPFDPFQRVYYEIILIFQTWHGLITIWFMLCGDLLFCIFLSHITTQFDLLAVRIKKLVYVPLDRQLLAEFPLGVYSEQFYQKEKSAVDSCDDREWEKRHQREISEIILKHRALIRLSGDVENMFSFALLVNFFNSSIIICFCGFCCIIVEKWNEMVYKSFLTTALSQTWLLCWYGQRLLESSTGLSDALYSSGWYRVSKRISNAVIIMINRTQKEVHVTTYGFSVMSLASYTTIIKTSWSYFTLLLNIYKQ